jgi:NAD(P)-dependent dehydrogenase (short-subunit alcohol dehydrogenase family)
MSKYQGAPETDWANKVVLVTGASSGLGKVTAECFADAGAQVVAINRRDNIMTEWKDDYANITPFVCDIKAHDQVVALFEMIDEKFGRIDVVVNNAGVAGKIENSRVRLHNYPVDEFADQIVVNVIGTYHVSREALALMLKTETRGLIINIASTAADRAVSGGGGYSPSKAGVAMLTDLIAREYATNGIRAVAIHPGFFPNTDNFAGRPAEQMARFAATGALGRGGQNWEIAEACKFLASGNATYMTGSHVHIDGGTLCGANEEAGKPWNKE